MKKISDIASKYKTPYKAAKALKTSQTQLQRWVDNGALADEDGNVYIKTKGKIKVN